MLQDHYNIDYHLFSEFTTTDKQINSQLAIIRMHMQLITASLSNLQSNNKNSPIRGLRSSPDLDHDLGWPWKSYRRECLINL